MQTDKEFLEKIGRADSTEYTMSDKFKSFFTKASLYFMENADEELYGINMTPKGSDAIVAVKTLGIYPFGEKTKTTIENLFAECSGVSFEPHEGFMTVKMKYKNAFIKVSEE